MRVLAVARASAVQKGGKETSSKEAKKGRHDKQKKRKRNSPSEALAAFRYSTHSLPKVTNFLIKFCPEIVCEF
jgi:hypothetical protein